MLDPAAHTSSLAYILIRPEPVRFHPASLGSVIAFAFICVAVLGALLAGVWASALREGVNPVRRTSLVGLGTAIWLAIFSGVVWSAWLETDPQRTLLFMVSVNVISLVAGLSPLGRWLAGTSLTWLVAFQSFRLPLELVLHEWVSQKVIPETMTWSGLNWDIVTGVVALVCAPFVKRFTALAWLVNAVGLLLLANVIRVAVMSSPLPFGWPVTPKLALIYHLPYALILPVCVGGALIGHVALTRALLAKLYGSSSRSLEG